MTLREALTAAFLPDCRDDVERGTLTGTTAEDMADELARWVVIATAVNESNPRPDTVMDNLVYAGVVSTCEGKESARLYSGNGHHWAQRLTALAVESADVREAWGR